MVTEKLSLTCDRLLSHRQLACCHSYSGIPLHGKDILIHSNAEIHQEPLLLTGHHGEISAMTFGKGNAPVLLCSASADYIIVWDVELCRRRTQEGKVAAGTVIGSLLGEVVHLSFCFSDERVAACSGATVYILSSKRQDTISALTSHLGPLTSAEFCPWNKEILVTTSEDRTFKVGDLKTEAFCYQSFVLSASPLLSVFLSEENRYLITGSTDGQLWCFSVSDDNNCQLVTKMDLQKMEKRHQMHQGTPSVQAGCTEKKDKVETSKPVLRMALCSSFPDTSRELRKDSSWLCIGSSDGLYVVDLATSELLKALYFKDYPNLSITLAGSWSIVPGWDDFMLFLVSSLFTPCVVLLELRLHDLRMTRACGEGFSVFPSSPPLRESPLKAELKTKEPEHPKKKGGIKEQPLVFHSKVKSSGYTTAPRRILFSPKTNIQKNFSSKKANKNSLIFRDYPEDSAAPTVPHIQLSIANKPVHCLQYSGDGKQILCGLGDSSVLLYKSSLTGNPTAYTGHDKPVSSVSWSLNRQWWLSASEDQSLRVWTSSPEPAITMSDRIFSKPIRNAQFYYLDKFLLLASGPSLYLYLYNVDITRDDIKRYQQRSVVKLAKCITTASATDISALSAINDFFSYIVLACGSDRSIQVFDMNKGKVASELPDAHSRAIHCITQNKGSMFSTQATDSYNLFLTSAVTDGLKLWDLRTLRCVRRYENHLNRCHPCSAAISPCGRFLASGSEDNCAYVYDIRSSSYLHKLQKHSDTVLSVTFNPASPELLTGTLDGKLRLFQSSSGAHLSHDIGAAVHSVPNMTA